MSKETSGWLNTMTLVGYTDERGHAWHYRAEDQGAESNHYPHAIPVEDVTRRLFNFQVVELPLFVPDGQGGYREVEGRKAMAADDNYDVLGVFKGGYAGHQYPEWLLEGPAALIDTSSGELGIGSAGLLKNRGVAWVSIEMEKTVSTPEGVDFRPYLLAATSFDGSLATTYKRVQQLTVCDNTMEMALSERGQQVKIKHSSGSGLRLGEAREALNIIFEQADAFAAEVAKLASWKVTTRQFDKVLDAIIPVPEIPAGKTATRGFTIATNKQEALRTMYARDIRVSPWKGTAFGVLQAFNTFAHHEAGVKASTNRAQRNMLRAIEGQTLALDTQVLSVLTELAPRPKLVSVN
jgi:phage/plasmid-like protein (TIGR03299 family)